MRYTNWSISYKVNKITRMGKKEEILASKLQKKDTKNLHFFNKTYHWIRTVYNMETTAEVLPAFVF